MELTVYWTQFAEEKLEDIFNYYKYSAGTKVAQKLVNGIIEKSLELNINPEGKQLEELLSDRVQDFRYVVYKSYKIIYWIDNSSARILVSHVFDSRQNPEKISLAK
jgi:plasmid stabilization system protein ParE